MGVCPACNGRYGEETAYCPKDGTQIVADSQPGGEGLVGQVIADRYRIVRKLGEGGMGEVYEARHVYIEKRVALKLLRPEIMSNQEAVTRFYQEARSASAIGHENIVEIDDFGKLPDGRVYLTMEYLDGQSLNDALQTPMELGRCLDIVIQVCRGLAAAHAKGIVHRDMKPENVFLVQKDGKETAKILDFGIAKVSGTEGNQHLTRTGTIFGTPHYMSPEQALGKPLDHRADIYSVGVIMYEMFTGTVPFKAESFMGILTQHLTTQPTPPHEQAPERAIPLPVEAIILKAMQKEVDHRYQTMNEMLADLEKLRRDLEAGVPFSPQTVLQPGPPPALMQAGAAVPGASAAITAPRPSQPGAMPPGYVTAATVVPAAAWPPAAQQAAVPQAAAQPGGLPPTATVPVQAPPPYAIPAGQAPGARMAPDTALVPPRPAEKKGKGGLVVGIVVAVVLLGGAAGGAALFWDDLMGGDPKGQPPRNQKTQPPAKQVQLPPKPVQPPQPPREWTSVQVTSTPMGATVFHEGKELHVGSEVAKTPVKLKVPPDRIITYVLKMDGYKDAPVVFNPGETEKRHVMMEKVGGAPKDPPKPRHVVPKPKPKPDPPPFPADPYERLH